MGMRETISEKHRVGKDKHHHDVGDFIKSLNSEQIKHISAKALAKNVGFRAYIEENLEALQEAM